MSNIITPSRFIKHNQRLIITADTTWTKPANLVKIFVQLVGPGGGGGGSDTGASAAAGGGGGGGYVAGWLNNANLSATEAIVIGLGGAGGTNTGGNGQYGSPVNTTFSTGSSAMQGNGGGGGTGVTTAVANINGQGGTSGSGVVQANVYNSQLIIGGNGGEGFSFAVNYAVPGFGAASFMGNISVTELASAGTDTAGAAGLNYGGGGAGAVSKDANGVAGGNGAPGICIIDEWVYAFS